MTHTTHTHTHTAVRTAALGRQGALVHAVVVGSQQREQIGAQRVRELGVAGLSLGLRCLRLQAFHLFHEGGHLEVAVRGEDLRRLEARQRLVSELDDGGVVHVLHNGQAHVADHVGDGALHVAQQRVCTG